MPSPSPARNLVAPAAAVLCLAVSWIHVQDQGGFPGDKTPHYVGIGYYVLELAGLIAAGILVTTGRSGSLRAPWLLAAGVALGPLTGYVLSRGPGLPDYSDDKGNWTEPLGLISLVVEGALLVMALAVLAADRRARTVAPARS